MTGAGSTKLRVLAGTFFVLVAVVGIALGVSVMVRGYSPVPFADFWSELNFVRDALMGDVGPVDFWAQHNEHRILVARLQFLVDYAFFSGTNVFLFVAIALSSLVLAAAYAVAAYVDTGDTLVLLGVVAVAAPSMMSPAGIENLTWAFQVQFVQVFMFATLATLAVTLAARSGSSTRRTVLTAAAALFAVAATYSMANGLFAWPVVVALALALRLGTRHTAALATAGVGTIGSFLWHFEGAHSEASGPIDVLTFVAAYLGSAVWGAGFHAAVVIGSIGLLLFLLAIVLAWSDRFGGSVSLPFGAGVATFVVLTAGQTAVGRLHLGTHQAIASRYVIASVTFWLALVVVYLLPIRERLHRYPNMGLAYLACAAAATLLVGFRTLPDPDFLRTTRFGREATVLTYRTGVIDDSGTVTGVAVDYSLRGTLRWMERERLGPFASGGLADRMSVIVRGEASKPCLGAIDSSQPVKRGHRLRGWIAAPSGEPASRYLVVLDTAGRRVGAGLVGAHRPDVAATGSVSSEWKGFAAYIGTTPRGPSVVVLVADDGRTPICRLTARD